MILKARELREDDAQIFSALGNFDSCEFFHAKRVGPVVGHRAEVIEPVCVWHRTKIASLLADLLVVAVQIPEDGLELANNFAFECHVHSKYAMCRRMLRPHRYLEQLTFQSRSHSDRRPLHRFECFNRRAHVF